jgi:hypothetical protein
MTTDQSSPPRDRFTLFLGLACAALAVLTLLLSWQNRNLKAELAAAVGAPPVGALKAGDTLGAFDVVDATGKQSHIGFDGHGRTLLLVFSSTCGACRETIPTWNRLLAEGVPSAVQVVGLQTDFQHGGAAAPPIPDLRFPVFGAVDPKAEPLSKFPAIPGAAVIDATGAVTWTSIGVPTDAQVSELRRALAG